VKPTVNKEQQQTNKQTIADKAKSQEALLKDINQGVSDGFEKVVEATQLIEDGKEKEAIKALQDATGKFDIALAANPDLGMIPVVAEVDVNELLTTPDLVKIQVELVRDLLKDSKVQVARALLMPLQDEMVTTTTYLPMATYPAAIKLATKSLIEGKKDEASAMLSTALSTFVEKESVIPLSLLRAEAMVATAAELEKEKDKEKALVLLSGAQEQLKLATALGYTSKDSKLYEDLSDQIKAVKKEAKGPNAVEKLYTKLKSSIKNLVDNKSEQAEKPKQEGKK
jgi:hypothetical protein